MEGGWLVRVDTCFTEPAVIDSHACPRPRGCGFFNHRKNNLRVFGFPLGAFRQIKLRGLSIPTF